MLCPAPRVTGVVAPLKLNPVPLVAICDMVTLVPPVLVTVSAKEELLPTVIVPNARLVGSEVRDPGVTVTPAADKPTVRGESVASEVTVTLPLTAPADSGAKVTLNVVL